MTPPAHVIALGGGGFSDGRDPGLDAYILEQARTSRPRIGFIGTASGDADSYLAKFYTAFSKLDCRPSHVPLFRRTPDLARELAELDVVFVGGGNTRSMLAVWREWGLDRHLADAGRSGTVLAGISAGAICWFAQGVTDSSASGLEALAGLGLVEGSCCPHYDAEAERRPAYHALMESGRVAPGWALEDGTAAHFEHGALARCISAREGAGAYAVALCEGRVEETPLDLLRVDGGG